MGVRLLCSRGGKPCQEGKWNWLWLLMFALCQEGEQHCTGIQSAGKTYCPGSWTGKGADGCRQESNDQLWLWETLISNSGCKKQLIPGQHLNTGRVVLVCSDGRGRGFIFFLSLWVIALHYKRNRMSKIKDQREQHLCLQLTIAKILSALTLCWWGLFSSCTKQANPFFQKISSYSLNPLQNKLISLLSLHCKSSLNPFSNNGCLTFLSWHCNGNTLWEAIKSSLKPFLHYSLGIT